MNDVSKIAEEVALIMPRISRKIFADILQTTDIPHAQLFVIKVLFDNGPSRAADLGRELQVSAPTVSGIVDRLEKAGYVRRSPDKEDRRSVMIELTPEGKKLVSKLRDVFVRHWIEILGKISQEDAEKYLEILRKIKEAI